MNKNKKRVTIIPFFDGDYIDGWKCSLCGQNYPDEDQAIECFELCEEFTTEE